MKHPITPIQLPLGLGIARQIEIKVNYSIGDHTTDLIITFYDGNVVLNPSPLLVAVPAEQMQSWDYDFAPIVGWVCNQLGAEILPQNPS